MLNSGTSLRRSSKLDLTHWYFYGRGRYGAFSHFFLPAVEDSYAPEIKGMDGGMNGEIISDP
jgi:hypothetical protein